MNRQHKKTGKNANQLLRICLGIGMLWLASGQPGAQAMYQQNFDSLVPGPLAGQDAWLVSPVGGQPTFQVAAGQGVGGTQAAYVHDTTTSFLTYRNVRALSETIAPGLHMTLSAQFRATPGSQVAVGFSDPTAPGGNLIWASIYDDVASSHISAYYAEMAEQTHYQQAHVNVTSPGDLAALSGWHSFLIDWLVGSSITYKIVRDSDSAVMLSATLDDSPSQSQRITNPQFFNGLQLYNLADGGASGSSFRDVAVDNILVNIPEASTGVLLLGGLTLALRRRSS